MKLTNEQKSLAVALYEEKLNEPGRLTAQEITDYINEELGLECDESTYRKAYKAAQLLRIVEAMTEQAIGYSTYLKKKLEQIAKEHPSVIIHFIHVSKDNHSELRLHGTSRDELPENLQMLICDKLNDFVETAHSFGALGNLDYTYGDEVVATINGLNVLFAHSHQYGKNDNILEQARKRHELDIHCFVGAHWHQYKHTNRDSYHGVQTSLIFVNPVVGDTDYSEKLFYSSRPGHTVIYVDGGRKCFTSKQVLID